MRIIAGQRRGHKIDGPRASADTRPTSDMVRESLFNILREPGRRSPRHRPLRRHRRPRSGGPQPGGPAGDLRRAGPRERRPDLPQYRHAPVRGPRPGQAGRRLSLGPVVPAGRRPPVVVSSTRPIANTRSTPRQLNQMIAQLVDKLPAGSVIALEAGASLDGRILPDFESLGHPPLRRARGSRSRSCRGRPVREDSPPSQPIRPRNEAWRRGGGGRTMSDAEAQRASLPWRSSAACGRRVIQALWAGGCVRDLLLGQTPADYDVATAATPEQVMQRLALPGDHGRDLVRRRPGPRPAASVASKSRSRRSAATVPMSTAAGPSRSSSARPSSTPPAATSRSTACSWTRSRAQLIDYVGGQADLRTAGPAGHRRPRGAVPRRQAAAAPRRPAGGPVPASDRAGHASGPRGDGRRGRRRLRRADRPGAAADARPRDRAPAMDLALETGLVAAILPPLVRDEGALPGQADAARGRPLGPYHAGPRALARRIRASRWPSPRFCTTSASPPPESLTTAARLP